MLSRTKDTIAKLRAEIEEVGKEAQGIINGAAKEKRSKTDEENHEVAELFKKMETLRENQREYEEQLAIEQGIEDAVKDAGREPGLQMVGGLDSIESARQVKTFGEIFVESEQFKSAQSALKAGSRSIQTGAVNLSAKGTLLEGDGITGGTPGTGGALASPVPQVVPGVVETLFQRLTVADLLPTGTANTNALRIVVEGTATSGAAGVGEGGTKPESELALSPVDEPVVKIATSLTVSDEMLEDASQVASYINSRLALFVKIEEERELVLGSGSPELTGFVNRGINSFTVGTVDNNAVALFKVINNTRGSSFLDVDGIIMNPANWQTTRLLQDSAQQFYGGGPFTAAYGGPQGPTNDNQLRTDSIWNVPVVITTAIGSGTALVGSFRQGAQLFRRGGLTVEATNSHADYFELNLVKIRAEERLALAVYRPSAFTVVDGLD